MDDRTAHFGLWGDTAGELAFEPFRGDRIADVAVIGGGYTGVSAALHLAEAGVDAVLLEAKEIGYGGSGRNVGLVNAGLWMFPDDVVAALGPAYGERLLAILGRSPDLVFGLIDRHGIQCEAVRNGTLHCAHSPQGYRQLGMREEQWGRRGAPVTLLGPQEAVEKIGSRSFHGALLDLRAGTIQPLAFAVGLAAAAAGAGARLHTGSPVIAIERRSGRWRLTTPAGTLKAAAVILATNAYPEHAFKNLNRNYIPFNYFQFATEPLPESIRRSILPGGHGAWDTATVLSSYRLDRAGRLIVGSVGLVDATAGWLHRNWAARTIKTVFPQAGRVPLTHAWHGRIGMTGDHIPRLHLPGPDMVAVTGYNGRGIGPGTVFGKLMAEYVTGGSVNDMPLPVSRQEPVFLRGAYGLFYEAGARLYHLLQRRWLW